MSSRNILISAPFDPVALKRLESQFVVHPLPPEASGTSLSARANAAELASAEVIVAELDEIDQATLDAAPNLRLVVACRASPVNVDIAACSARGIAVATTPGRNADVTADFSFALLMATVRKVSESERWLRAGNWSAARPFEPYERFRGIGLSGRTLGIVGGGNVGRRVMQRALGFNMTVQIADPFLTDGDLGEQARVVDLDTLMGTSDIVSVHAPLTPETRGLIGKAELALMRPTAYLINAGRAAIIDEAALIETLRENRIAGAGFDVYYDEPLDDTSVLYTFDNVTLTPHIAGASDDVVVEHSRLAIDAIEHWAAGDLIPHVVNRDALHARTTERTADR